MDSYTLKLIEDAIAGMMRVWETDMPSSDLESSHPKEYAKAQEALLTIKIKQITEV